MPRIGSAEVGWPDESPPTGRAVATRQTRNKVAREDPYPCRLAGAERTLTSVLRIVSVVRVAKPKSSTKIGQV